MPSSHTAFAVVMSVFLAALYPRLKWFAAAMALLVGLLRVHFGGHWPSDVVVGAAIGYAIARACVRGMWGVRLLDWVWIRFVDRSAEPAWPKLAASSAR
jgi:undecaprenyl-diphosphatase